MRVRYFDGLKGVAAIIVMLTHFMGCFNLYKLQQIPIIEILFDGNMAVYIFIILSTFGICCSLNNNNPEDIIAKICLKRYFRLTIPLILPTLFASVVCMIKWNYNVQASELTNNPFTYVLLPEHTNIKWSASGIVFGVLKGNAFITPLWMMKYIFGGTFLCLPLYYTVRKLKKTSYKLFFLVLYIIIFYHISSYWSACIIGVALAVLHKKEIKKSWIISIISLMIIVIGDFMNLEMPKLVKGVLLIATIEYGILFRKLFSMNIIKKISDISYQLYLVHVTVLASICCYCYLYLYETTGCYLILIAIYILLSIGIASIFTKIDVWCMKKMDRIYNKIL